MNALTTPLCALLGIEVPIVQAQAGALHVHTVGSVPEARQAVEAGVDVIVAQGWEAGGHATVSAWGAAALSCR